MHRLRSMPTRRLLAVLGAIVVLGVGAALALAAGSGGPTPPPESLAQAVHGALTASPPAGITARVQFTNRMLDSAGLESADPVLTGASGRLWWGGEHRLRLELQSDQGDAQVVVNGRRFFLYDGANDTAYAGLLPRERRAARPKAERVPTAARIQRALKRLMGRAVVSDAVPGNEAGQPAYTVRVAPRRAGGLLGAVQLAWDAARGTPLRLAVFAHGDGTPVLELKATDISYGPVDPSVFDLTPPAGAHVTRVQLPREHRAAAARRARRQARAHLRREARLSPAAVARRLSFRLSAPATLAGQRRTAVRLLRVDGHAGALVFYGRGLGGIAVLEHVAKAERSASGGGRPDQQLPTVDVGGASAQELPTPLGTLLTFTRNGVSYTVAGSVPAGTAIAAARGL